MLAGTRGRELPMPNTCKQFNFLLSPQTRAPPVRCLNGSEPFSNVSWGCLEPPGDLLVVQGHRMPRTQFVSSDAKIYYCECRFDEERTCNGERNAQGRAQWARNSKKIHSEKAAKTVLVTSNGNSTFSVGAYSFRRTVNTKKCTSGPRGAERTH